MKRSFLLITLLVTLMVSSFAVPITKTVVLRVQTPETVWHDSRLAEMLITSLTQHEQIRVTDASKPSLNMPPFPKDAYNLEALVGWGQEIGGSYLVYVNVGSERLERKNTFSLPLIFKKYETIGVIEGEIRICDLSNGRLLRVEPFKYEKKGPKILQASMNDTPDDPDLHLTSMEKIRFFNELELETIAMITKKTKESLGLRR